MTDILLILINIFLAVTGQTLIKQGMNKIGSFTDMPLVQFFQRSLLSPLVLSGLFLYVASSFIWFMVLSRVDLSVAYPALSLGYILILAIGFFLLGETITPVNTFRFLFRHYFGADLNFYRIETTYTPTPISSMDLLT